MPERAMIPYAEVADLLAARGGHRYAIVVAGPPARVVKTLATERAARRWIDREYHGAGNGHHAWVFLYDRRAERRLAL